MINICLLFFFCLFFDLLLQFIYSPSEEMRKLQKKMAALFEKQKLKGGIIDIEGERNRYLIDITSVRGRTAPFNKTQVCRQKVDFSRHSSISRKYLSMLLRC